MVIPIYNEISAQLRAWHKAWEVVVYELLCRHCGSRP